MWYSMWVVMDKTVVVGGVVECIGGGVWELVVRGRRVKIIP